LPSASSFSSMQRTESYHVLNPTTSSVPLDQERQRKEGGTWSSHQNLLKMQQATETAKGHVVPMNSGSSGNLPLSTNKGRGTVPVQECADVEFAAVEQSRRRDELITKFKTYEKSYLRDAAMLKKAHERLQVVQEIAQREKAEGREVLRDLAEHLAEWDRLGSALDPIMATRAKDPKICELFRLVDSSQRFGLQAHPMLVEAHGPDGLAEVKESARVRSPVSIKRADRVLQGEAATVGHLLVAAYEHPLAPDLEKRFRVGTWDDVPVYGIEKAANGDLLYAEGTELHLVWDMDQSKLVGEGTNDIELVFKCFMWWQEELKHDANFVPAKMGGELRNLFEDFCWKFNVTDMLDGLIPYIVRPGLAEFAARHPGAKWWTFTNKDRTIEGKVVREVSDEEGLAGWFGEMPHEVSGRQMMDANKVALRLLEDAANRYTGMVAEERPLIGVRGEQKDMSRIAKLIAAKNRAKGVKNGPCTIVMLDDKDTDSWNQCQANERRCLGLVPSFSAFATSKGAAVVAEMERACPAALLSTFYHAFRNCDPSHALVQCVEIMSDEASTMLKRRGGSADKYQFVYEPKTEPAEQQPPALFDCVAVKSGFADK